MDTERPAWAHINTQVVLRAKKRDKTKDLTVTVTDASEEAVLLEHRLPLGSQPERLEFLYITATGEFRETTKGKPWGTGEIALLDPESEESDLIISTYSFQQDLKDLFWSVDDLRAGTITKRNIHEFLAHLALGLASANHLLTLLDEDGDQ